MNKLPFFALSFLLFFACASPDSKAAEDRKIADPDAAFFFIRGYEAELSHNWHEAERHYLRALEKDPESRHIRVQLGYVLVRMDRSDEALVLMDALLVEQPEDLNALKLKGDLLRQQKKYRDAVPVFEKIADLQPGNTDNLFELGLLHYFLGRHDQAIEVLGELVKRDAGSFRAFDLLGSVYIDKKDYDRASEFLKTAIGINPDLDTAYFKLGAIAETRNDLVNAIRNYEEAVRINSYNVQMRQRLAQAYLKFRTSGKTLDDLKIISRQLSGDADLHVRIGMFFFEEKQYDKALEELNAALTIRPDSPVIMYYLALVLEETGKYDEALQLLKLVIKQEPSNIRAFLHIAYIYGKQKRNDEAIGIYEEILSFETDKPEIYLYYANELIQKKEYLKVEVLLQETVARFKDNDELYFMLAVVYEKTGRFDDMVIKLRKAIEINPRNAEALNYLGYSFAEKGSNLDEALSLINRALELKPENGYYIDSLGWVYYKQGKYEQALDALIKAAGNVEDDPVINEHLGDVYHAMGLKVRAADAWRRALQLHEKEEGLKERVEGKLSDLENAAGK